jgi:hypothetical protein
MRPSGMCFTLLFDIDLNIYVPCALLIPRPQLVSKGEQESFSA